MERLCKFAVLRYVPDENRQEFINVGLVFHSPEDGYIDMELTTNFSRVTAFDDEIDINFLKIVLNGVKSEFTQSTIHGPSWEDIKDWNYLERATSIYVNQLQFSPIQIIRSTDIHKDFQDLFRTYVYFDVQKPNRITEDQVKSIMNRVLREKQVLPRLNRGLKVDIGAEEIELDYSYRTKNITKLIKTFSFDYAPTRSSQAPIKAKEWVYNYNKLRKVNFFGTESIDPSNIQIVTFVYTGQTKTKNIITAIKILREESEIIEANNEESIEEFAKKITMELNQQ